MLIDSDQVAPTMNLKSSTNAPIESGSQSASTEARRSGSSPTRPLDRGTMEQVARQPQTPAQRTGTAAMSRHKARGPSDYDVGYGRPPKVNRFRPGQSGNPTGYRKGSKTIGARLRELMNSKVTVTEHGRTRRISRLDVMLRQLTNDAMHGDQRALKLLMEFLHRYGAEVEGTVGAEEITCEDLEILSDYLRKTGSSDSDLEVSPDERDGDDGESL
jgi:hypothetical protein